MKANANRKHTKLDNKAFILFVLLLSYLVNFTACSFFDFKKPILTYRGSELENKRINFEKADFRAIPTESDADLFILWCSMINDVTEFSTH